MDVVLNGPEGTSFFRGFTPDDLTKPSNVAGYHYLRACVQKMLEEQSIIDCSVKPFVFTNSHGICSVAGKIFATRLVLDDNVVTSRPTLSPGE